MLPIPIIIMLSTGGFCILTCCLDVIRDFSLGEDKIHSSPYDMILNKLLCCYDKEDDIEKRRRIRRIMSRSNIEMSLSSINE